MAIGNYVLPIGLGPVISPTQHAASENKPSSTRGNMKAV